MPAKKNSWPKKSLWKDPSRQTWSFYCPFCRIPRRIPYQPKPGPRHFFQVGLTSAVFMLATWSWFSWKGIVCFFPFWIVFEIVYRARVRAALACTHCGFDPYLYLNDRPRAREVVENHWKNKIGEKAAVEKPPLVSATAPEPPAKPA